MIREATQADIPKIVELGSLSLIEGPYGGLIKDKPETTAKLAFDVIQEKGHVLLYENEDREVCGLLAFIVFPHYFTGEKTAGELIWYVRKKDRIGCPAVRLLWAAQELAKKLGCKHMQFTAPTSEVGNLYKRFGYSQIEVTFQKAL